MNTPPQYLNDFVQLTKLDNMLKTIFFLLICINAAQAQVSSDNVKVKKIRYSDDFEAGYDTTKWFADLSKKPNNTVTVQNGAMVIDVNYGATVWFKQKLGDAWVIEFDRTVPMEGKPNDRAVLHIGS